MTDIVTPRRVLMIGAGRRVQNNFLPALACLRDDFTVSGIVAPSDVRRDPLARQWNLSAYSSIGEVDLSTIDVVAISVPTAQNAAVLRDLLPQAARLHLVIDTPIAWNAREFAECAALLRRFVKVTVAEDYMNFPSFALARTGVAAGLTGNVTWLTLNNIGFFYHGLALIRSFADFARVRTARRSVVGDQMSAVVYSIGTMRASVIGPYRGHTTGGLVVTGNAGGITQFPKDVGNVQLRCPHHLLAPVVTGDVVTGFAIEAGGRSLELAAPEIAAMSAFDFPDKSLLNLERGCGLIAVFRSLIAPDPLNARYSADEAFYDRLVSMLATRGRLPIDPFALLGSSIMRPYALAAQISQGRKASR